MIFAVTLARGGPWNWSCGLRDQDGFEQHGRFMDALVDDGFVLLGGPLALDREVLLVIKAASEQEVRERLDGDPWHRNRMLSIASIRFWTVLLDGVGVTDTEPRN